VFVLSADSTLAAPWLPCDTCKLWRHTQQQQQQQQQQKDYKLLLLLIRIK